MATTWDPLKKSTSITLSNGNNTAIANTNGNVPNGVKTVHPITAKSYFETEMVSKSTEVYAAVGVGSLAWSPDTDYIGSGSNVNIGMLTTNGNANFNGSLLWSMTGPAAGRRIATAIDPVGKLYWARIETSAGVYGNWNNSGTANPATGTGGNSFSTLTGPLFAACCCPGIVSTVADSWILHSASSDWTGTAPSGFAEINPTGTTYTQLITTTGASSVTVPSDWNSSNNFVGALASGGAGYRIATGALLSGGGAGGMYAQKNNVSLTPGGSLPVQVAAAATGVTTATVVNGADSWAGNATEGSAFVVAVAGPGGNGTTGGTAASTGGVGDVINNGGNGSNSVAATNGGGGGGAAGPNGAGNNANTNGSGGQGDNTSGGAGGAVSSVGTVGTAGTEFTDSFSGVVAGSGGGSGSSNAAFAGNGKTAGNYGAGGAGLFSSGTTSRSGGSSTKGFVVLQWTTSSGGISASAAQTTDAAVSAGASALKIQATSADTTDAATSSAAGAVKIQATSAVTTGIAVSAATGGATAISGSAAQTTDAATSAGVGALKIQASAADAAGAAVSAGAGAVKIQANAAQTTDAAVSAAVGAGATPISASAAQTTDAATSAGVGALKVKATSAVTTGVATMAGAGIHADRIASAAMLTGAAVSAGVSKTGVNTSRPFRFQMPPIRWAGQDPKLTAWLTTISQMARGRSLSSDVVTLTPSATSTVVTADHVSNVDHITLMPMTAAASTAYLAGWYIVPNNGSFTIFHASNAATDQVFRWNTSGG